MNLNTLRTALAVSAFCVALTPWAGCRGGTEAAATTPEALQIPVGKLPEGVRPTGYRLSLTIIPNEKAYSGTAVISIELDEPSNAIWMHGQDLNVTAIHAAHATARIPARWEQKTSDGVVRVEFEETLPAGKSTLHIEYTAGFVTPLRGLYRVETGGRAYAFTQFESISARLAFPCFDEPRFKTPFDVTLTVPADQIAVANTPVDRAIKLPEGLQRISYVPTPPLPTYLIAWAVGPLDVVSGPPIPPTKGRPFPVPLRGIAAKGQGGRLSYALERTGAFVAALEEYFGIPYPYRKLDLAAVPDFGAGAMENVGLITFREWFLLIDEERATEDQRRMFAYVLAHELAHQWFGNLVTMPWWDDIWLNESFATWMGGKVVQTLHPEYHSELGSLASAHGAMGLDSLTSARSIQQPVPTNQDINNAFSAITYAKGGAVLEMFERWMGPDTFREAIGVYLRRHEGGTATSGDLLAALDEVSDAKVSSPFKTFLTQPGVPLITGTAQSCEDGSRKVQLAQRRDFPIGSTGDPRQVWEIPFCVRHEGGTTCGRLNDAEGYIDLPGCPSWWMPNADGGGYFRFSMSGADWTRLRTKGFARLSERGKMAVADSVSASFDRGAVDVKGLLPWFPKFVTSPLRQVATVPMAPLRFMVRDAAPPQLQRRVRSYAGRLYQERYNQLGWHASRRDSSDTKLLREAVIRFMVMDVRDRKARSRAARLGRAYAGYLTKPRPDAIDPQIAALVLAAAVQEGGDGLFDHLLVRLDASADATMRNSILAALGHAEDPALSTRALDLSLDPRLRVNEIGQVLRGQFHSVRTRERAWAWLMEHFDELAARFGAAQGGALPWYAASLCSEEAAVDVQRFFEPRVAEMAGGPRNLAGAVEAISLCAKRASVIGPGVEQAFGPH